MFPDTEEAVSESLFQEKTWGKRTSFLYYHEEMRMQIRDLSNSDPNCEHVCVKKCLRSAEVFINPLFSSFPVAHQPASLS
jgi:hypothetical protein